MKAVEVLPALAWVCDECGERNYADLITAGPDPESADSGEWMLAPETVTCGRCKVEFSTNTDGLEGGAK